LRRALTAAACAALAALPPFFLAVEAWPEIVVPAYFITRGGVLYDSIIFPHTPLLILFTALLGKIFGFSATLFRAEIALSMAATGALIGVGARSLPRALAGVAAFIVLSVYATSVTLWPDPLMAPLALAAALALERFGESGSRRALAAGALLLGLCIVIKQTSAWLALAGGVWVFFVTRGPHPALRATLSPRERAKTIAVFAGCAALPYAIFVIGWGALFRTTSHVYWTLILPLSGHSGEITIFSPAMLVRMLLLLAIIPLATTRWRSPLPWLALGAIGMAWPRIDLLHLSAAFGILALLVARAIPSRAGGAAGEGVSSGRALALAAVLVACAIIPRWRWHGPVFFWTDRATTFYAEQVRRRVRPGGALVVFNTQNETLYAVTGTTTPSGIYVNPKFWYYLNRRGLGERLCRDLAARHGTPILFSYLDARVEDPRATSSCLYAIVARAPVIEQVNPATSWRVVP
jgi:hypothetical protein